MPRRRHHRARTDESSTVIQSSVSFTTTINWSDPLDCRDFSHVALYLNPTVIGEDLIVLYVAWSDDGTTIPFDSDDNQQMTDFNITNNTDGSFNPKVYKATFSTFEGNIGNQTQHLVYPVKAGFMRVGVLADDTLGTYSINAQRLVR